MSLWYDLADADDSLIHREVMTIAEIRELYKDMICNKKLGNARAQLQAKELTPVDLMSDQKLRLWQLERRMNVFEHKFESERRQKRKEWFDRRVDFFTKKYAEEQNITVEKEEAEHAVYLERFVQVGKMLNEIEQSGDVLDYYDYREPRPGYFRSLEFNPVLLRALELMQEDYDMVMGYADHDSQLSSAVQEALTDALNAMIHHNQAYQRLPLHRNDDNWPYVHIGSCDWMWSPRCDDRNRDFDPEKIADMANDIISRDDSINECNSEFNEYMCMESREYVLKARRDHLINSKSDDPLEEVEKLLFHAKAASIDESKYDFDLLTTISRLAEVNRSCNGQLPDEWTTTCDEISELLVNGF